MTIKTQPGVGLHFLSALTLNKVDPWKKSHSITQDSVWPHFVAEGEINELNTQNNLWTVVYHLTDGEN